MYEIILYIFILILGLGIWIYYMDFVSIMDTLNIIIL
jgi:hypothetical protein